MFLRSRLVVYATWAICAAGWGATSVLAAPDVRRGSTDRIIVKLRANAQDRAHAMSAQRAQGLAQRAGVALQPLRRTAVGADVLRLPQEHDLAQLQEVTQRIAADPDVEYVQPDYRAHPAAQAPTDPRFGDQWYLSDAAVGLDLLRAWDISIGNNVIVAVIDSGLVRHADIDLSRVVPGYDMISLDTGTGTAFTANDLDGRDPNPADPGDWIEVADEDELKAIKCLGANQAVVEEDSSWHGTSVAGIVGATTGNGQYLSGVSWNVRLLPVRVLGKCGGYISDIMEGAAWAAGLSVSGAPDNPIGNRAQILNLSLGVVVSLRESIDPCPPFERETIERILAAGTVKAIVAAAGNEGSSRLTSPGSCPGVISVTGIQRSGDKAPDSNYGDRVAISTVYGGPDVTEAFYVLANSGRKGPSSSPTGDIIGRGRGTSFSAALASGVAALMLSVDPTLTASQVHDIITDSARAFPAGSDCRTLGCGAGTLDAFAALSMTRDNPPAPRAFPVAAPPADVGGGSSGGGGGCTVSQRGHADLLLPALLMLALIGVVRSRRLHPRA